MDTSSLASVSFFVLSYRKTNIEEYCIDPGSALEIVPNGERDQEIEYDREDIIVYGWSDDMTVTTRD